MPWTALWINRCAGQLPALLPAPPLHIPVCGPACAACATVLQVKLSVRDKLADVPNGKYVCVAGISPTPLGEGKRCGPRL